MSTAVACVFLRTKRQRVRSHFIIGVACGVQRHAEREGRISMHPEQKGDGSGKVEIAGIEPLPWLAASVRRNDAANLGAMVGLFLAQLVMVCK